MTSFDYLWRLLDSHGVIESRKGEAAELWDTFNIHQQRHIYRKIRDKIRAGKYVDYNPVKAIRDNRPKLLRLSFDDYYKHYGTSTPMDGWQMVNPTGQKVIYVKAG